MKKNDVHNSNQTFPQNCKLNKLQENSKIYPKWFTQLTNALWWQGNKQNISSNWKINTKFSDIMFLRNYTHDSRTSDSFRLETWKCGVYYIIQSMH